jgi:single-stranded DNA-specific DHH superfamily exonuclease
MKNQLLADKIKALRAGADKSREHLAKDIFDLERIVELMAAATAKGFRAIKITPPVPIDLSGTKSANQLALALKEAGAEVEWVARAPTDMAAGERMSELVVRW